MPRPKSPTLTPAEASAMIRQLKRYLRHHIARRWSYQLLDAAEANGRNCCQLCQS